MDKFYTLKDMTQEDLNKLVLERNNLKREVEFFKTNYGILQNASDEYEDELLQKIDFLRKRENKLQLIEQMFKSGTIDLKELSDLVKGSE